MALIAFSYEAFVGDIYVNDDDDSIMLVLNLGVADDANDNQEDSASADGGPRSRVCARETLRSAPHRH